MSSNCTKRKYSYGYGQNWWVHFLIEQEYFGDDLVFVSGKQSIILDMTYKINKDVKHSDVPGQIADCSQFEWYFTLQNRNTSSAGHGRYMWFGLNLFDNRDAGKVDAEYNGTELGSGIWIYRPGSSKAFVGRNTLPAVGETVHVRLDITSAIQNAFNNAVNNGCMPNTKFSDLAIGAMNIGYETHSGRETSVTVYDCNIYYK